LVALAPDIILASGTLAVTALQHISRTLPIVFAAVADPVARAASSSRFSAARCRVSLYGAD